MIHLSNGRILEIAEGSGSPAGEHEVRALAQLVAVMQGILKEPVQAGGRSQRMVAAGDAQALQPVAYADPMAFLNFRAGAADKEWMWAKPDAGLVSLYLRAPSLALPAA